MSFYTDWKNNMSNPVACSNFIYQFLCSNPESVKPLINGNSEEIHEMLALFDTIPIDWFLECIFIKTGSYELNASDVPCFSNLDSGISRVNELLAFSHNGLTFEQLGYQLINSSTSGARIKYGENHAKLAKLMDLVCFSSDRPAKVYPTALGNYLISVPINNKREALKKLMLRNPCIQNLISGAHHGKIRFSDVVPFLTRSTMIRRRTSVRELISFILEDTNMDIMQNINWEIEVQ